MDVRNTATEKKALVWVIKRQHQGLQGEASSLGTGQLEEGEGFRFVRVELAVSVNYAEKKARIRGTGSGISASRMTRWPLTCP